MRKETFDPNSEKGLENIKFSNVHIIDFTPVKKGKEWHYLVECNNCKKQFLKAKWTFGVYRCQCYKTVNGAYNYQGYKSISSIYYKTCKSGAKSRNLEFKITKEDMYDKYMSQNGKCALSGLDIRIERNYKKMKEGMTASLDRIDSTKGYTLDNIQWVHKHLNKMKMNFDNDYFIKMCIFVAENNKIK
jgi:hypothetical protein